LFYKKESIKSTWKLRLALLMFVLLGTMMTRELWTLRIGQSLACREQLSQSDVILVDNIDPDYLLFERAETLYSEGFAPRVLVPVQVSHESERANAVSTGIAQLMARVAQVQTPEIVPIRAREPITLDAAYWLRGFLTKEHLRSVIVVTPGFRSRRSFLVYQSVLARAGITVSCVPVFIGAAPGNWSRSWHGIQEVSEQFLKLQFYRFYVLLKPASLERGTDDSPARTGGADPVPTTSATTAPALE
jgi:hypothetical protein